MEKIQIHQAEIQAYLESNRFQGKPKSLYEPIDYILSLGGKRIRPLLGVLGCQLFGGSDKEALPIAAVVEYFHNFSLLHDDIMDKADIRRGKPTAHVKYGINEALLSGDLMLIHAYRFLENYDGATLVKLLPVFNRISEEVCSGQQLDMEFESRNDVRLEEYLEMIGLKTAALLAGALELGGLVATKRNNDIKLEDIEKIKRFGYLMGMSFQLQDDYLDSFGNEAEFGKKIGGDILLNKKTYLAISALKTANEAEKRILLGHTKDGSEEAKIKAVQEIYSASGAKLACEKAVNHYFNEAKTCLESIQGDNAIKSILEELSLMLLKRKK